MLGIQCGTGMTKIKCEMTKVLKRVSHVSKRKQAKG